MWKTESLILLFKTLMVTQVFVKPIISGKKNLTIILNLNNLFSKNKTLEYRQSNSPG